MDETLKMKVAPNDAPFAAMRKWQTHIFFIFFSLKSVCSRETNIEWVAKLSESVSTNPIDFNGDFFLQRESDATAHRDKLTETP